jgi:hypothetical protein
MPFRCPFPVIGLHSEGAFGDTARVFKERLLIALLCVYPLQSAEKGEAIAQLEECGPRGPDVCRLARFFARPDLGRKIVCTRVEGFKSLLALV